MPGASYPKPDGQKVTRHTSALGWTLLPAAGRDGPTPKLPTWRQWSPKTRVWWKDLWTKPQATQWAQDGSTLFVAACLYDDLITGRAEAAKVSPEIRQHEDRHGLTDKAMLQLRWKIDEVESEVPDQRPVVRKQRSRQAAVLKIVDGG